MQPQTTRDDRRRQDHSQELAAKGWYHSFELPDGTIIEGVNPLARLRERFARFPIPADLRGKRVLDIGAWDGWFSFEAERRGAAVTAVDCVEVDHFLDLHRRLSSNVDYRIREVYELPEAGLGTFDIVLFLGVLYHLRHPLLALEMVCALTTEIAIVESFVTDGATWQEHTADIPTLEFYEGCELGNQFDNWVGPSVACLLAMCRAAGFARVELLRVEPHNALVACYRKWEPAPPDAAAEPPRLHSVLNSANMGVNFSTRKETYVTCWFHTSRPVVSPAGLRLEIDGFGAASYYLKKEKELWMANFPFPRGLHPGWREARLRFADSAFSNTVRIAVDMPLRVEKIVCLGVSDPATWRRDAVRATESGFVTCWVEGLPENADRGNVRVALGDARLRTDWVGEPGPNGASQINAIVPPAFPPGEHSLRIECGGVSSEPRLVRVI